MKLSLLIITMMISTSSMAAMPFSFIQDQPAIADEVNENFSFLENEITKGSNCPPSNSGVKFTYQRKDVPLGTVIKVGLTKFVVIKISFIDFASGIRYNITIPSTASPTNVIPSVTMSVNYKRADPQLFCNAGTISGFPTNTMAFEVYSKITYYAELNLNNINIYIGKKFEILVGSTIVRFNLGAILRTQTDVAIDPANTDYTQSFDPSNMVAPVTLMQDMDDLIDMIIIEKAP